MAPCSFISVWQNLGWTLMEDGSIRIEEATEEALGTYTCVPYNTLGTMGQSAPARLVLKVSPQVCTWPLWWAVLCGQPFTSISVLPLGPPVFYGATRLGVQAGGRPGVAHPLCSCRGPLPCHHLEEGTWALKLLCCGGRHRRSSGGSTWTCVDRPDVRRGGNTRGSGGALAMGSRIAPPSSSS